MNVFEHLLERHERLRHARILSSVPRQSPSTAVGVDGFLPPEDAAKVMGVSLQELALLVEQGRLEAEDVGMSELWVRPAVVSVLGVRQA